MCKLNIRSSVLVLAMLFGSFICSPPVVDAQEPDPTATQPAVNTTAHPPAATNASPAPVTPRLWAAMPFVMLLLSIATLPLIRATEHWWHHNKNKLLIALILSGITLLYYYSRTYGVVAHDQHVTEPGISTVKQVVAHAILDEYIPFIVLLFSLYTICGGIVLRGDLRANPATNTAFLGFGALIASFVGTTGASMLMIRPLLQTNRERHNVSHTVIFFIFLVSNIGGCLLPIGDPPLFLGYLRGVPFWWTLNLWKEWAFATAILLLIYYIWDTVAYKRETELERLLDKELIEPLSMHGSLNFLWLIGVVLAVALIKPGESFFGYFTEQGVPGFVREAVMLTFVGLAWIKTPATNRRENEFNFFAIFEVAALFLGIFITMQVPIEILHTQGPRLGLTDPAQFFWSTGLLSSFLDNAPTYVVFFETANSLTTDPGPGIIQLLGKGHYIRIDLLIAISLGAVFMGANTYIGNGPNFMVKSIAEHAGIKMPSFFGYMKYSIAILIPVFVLITFIFVR